MFAPETYRPTYVGPFMATGESLRRARNDAQAAGDAQAVRRAYLPQRAGVQAGSRNDFLRSSLMADSQQMQSNAQAMQAYNELAQSNANANLQGQIDLSKEMAGLRDLLYSKRAADYSLSASNLDREAQKRAFSQEMSANRAMAKQQTDAMKRRIATSVVTGLLGSVGFGQRVRLPE